MAGEYDDIVPTAPPQVRSSRPYHRDMGTYDDGSRQKCYATVDGKRFDFHVRDGTKDLTVLYEHFSQDYLDQCDRFRWEKVKKYKGKTVPMCVSVQY